jgi:hypothetical protein
MCGTGSLTGRLSISWMISKYEAALEYYQSRRETCQNATLATTNLTLTDLGANPGLRSEKPATNRLSYGTA